MKFEAPPAPDELDLRQGRLARLREEMARYNYPALVLHDPHNVRYATGARNMLPYILRNPARYVFVPITGPIVLFEFKGCDHLEAGNALIDEVRPAKTVAYGAAGPHLSVTAQNWADEIADLMRQHCPGERRIGLERFDAQAMHCLAGAGFQILDAQQPVERARCIKTPQELDCIRRSVACIMDGEWKLREKLQPGITENELWATLHEHVIANDGDYIETRLLTSGEKTNPWFQESGMRQIQAGELVAHDTDVIGPHGYFADFSRTFLCGDGKATHAQKELYGLAHEQIHFNMELLRAGKSFREVTEAAWRIPPAYFKRRYYTLLHGAGLTGEYPYLVNDADYDGGANYDGVIEENMTLCVESFIGHEDGGEGVKLEQQVLITKDGYELLSPFPFEDRLL